MHYSGENEIVVYDSCITIYHRYTMGNTGSVDADVSTDVMTNVSQPKCPDVRAGVDIGVNTDGHTDSTADALHNVEQQRYERAVVDNARLMETMYKLNERILFLENNVKYFRNWLLEIEEIVCDCCGGDINMPYETYACTKCCKFICEDCVDGRNEHKKCKKVLCYDDLCEFYVENTDDEYDDSDENTDSEDDDEDIDEEDEKKDAEKPHTDE